MVIDTLRPFIDHLAPPAIFGWRQQFLYNTGEIAKVIDMRWPWGHDNILNSSEWFVYPSQEIIDDILRIIRVRTHEFKNPVHQTQALATKLLYDKVQHSVEWLVEYSWEDEELEISNNHTVWKFTFWKWLTDEYRSDIQVIVNIETAEFDIINI